MSIPGLRQLPMPSKRQPVSALLDLQPCPPPLQWGRLPGVLLTSDPSAREPGLLHSGAMRRIGAGRLQKHPWHQHRLPQGGTPTPLASAALWAGSPRSPGLRAMGRARCLLSAPRAYASKQGQNRARSGTYTARKTYRC